MDLTSDVLAAGRLKALGVEIRTASAGCEARLQQVERLSGERFRDVGLAQIADDDPPPVEDLRRYIDDRRCLIAVDDDFEDPEAAIVGYLLLGQVDGNAHIEQVSVIPDRQGRGIGRLLVDGAERWALEREVHGVTLTTFTDVPWNRPLYEHLGFRVMDEQEIGPELRRLRETEAAHGLNPESRVCMVLDLAAGN
ncbi:MAG TPA: GNAT family N-acetyltransferase [Acidimicrobiales bacterium]|nr:GNAT family N-acetyltransferase [Acidimicrobiales bacterium]